MLAQGSGNQFEKGQTSGVYCVEQGVFCFHLVLKNNLPPIKTLPHIGMCLLKSLLKREWCTFHIFDNSFRISEKIRRVKHKEYFKRQQYYYLEGKDVDKKEHLLTELAGPRHEAIR